MSSYRFGNFIHKMLSDCHRMRQSFRKPRRAGTHNTDKFCVNSPQTASTLFERFDSCDYLENNYIEVLNLPQTHFLWSLICKIPPKQFPNRCEGDRETLSRYFRDSLWEKQMRRLISLENDGCQDEVWEFEIDWQILRAMLRCFSINLDECTTLPLPLLMIRRFVATDYHIESNNAVMTHRTVNNELATLLMLFPFRYFSPDKITDLWTNALDNVFNVGDNYSNSTLDKVISEQKEHTAELMDKIVATAQNSDIRIDRDEADASYGEDGLLSLYVNNYPVFVLLTPPKRDEVQTVRYRITLHRYQNEMHTDEDILKDDYEIDKLQSPVRAWLRYQQIRFLKATGMQLICYKMPWLRHSAFLETLLPNGCRGALVHYEHGDDPELSKALAKRYAPINSNGRTIFASLRFEPDVIAATAGSPSTTPLPDPKYTEAAHDQIELHLWMMPAFRVLLPFWGFFLFQIAFLISFWNLGIPEIGNIDTFRAIAVPILGTTLIFAAINEHHTLTALLREDRVLCAIMFGFDLALFLQKTDNSNICCDLFCIPANDDESYPYNGMTLFHPFVNESMPVPILQALTVLATWICIILLVILLVRLLTRTLIRFLFCGMTPEEYRSIKLAHFLLESAGCAAVLITIVSTTILLLESHSELDNKNELLTAAFVILVAAAVLTCISMRICKRNQNTNTHYSGRTYLWQEEERTPLSQDEAKKIKNAAIRTRVFNIARGTLALIVLAASLALLMYTLFYLPIR